MAGEQVCLMGQVACWPEKIKAATIATESEFSLYLLILAGMPRLRRLRDRWCSLVAQEGVPETMAIFYAQEPRFYRVDKGAAEASSNMARVFSICIVGSMVFHGDIVMYLTRKGKINFEKGRVTRASVWRICCVLKKAIKLWFTVMIDFHILKSNYFTEF